MTTPSPSVAAPDVVDDLVAALLTASRLLIGLSARSLADVADDQTLSEFRTLVVLEGRGPLTPSRVAELLAQGRQACGRMLDRLHDEELVHLTVDGAFALTRSGADLVASVTESRRSLLTEIVDRIPDDERQPLVDSLVALAQAAGEPLVT